MKSVSWFVVAMALGSSCLTAQVSLPAAISDPAGAAPALVEIGPDYRVWASFPSVVGPKAAIPSRGAAHRSGAHHRVVELTTGMNYWDGQNWVPSDPSFVVTDDAFVATRLQHKVQLNPNLNTIGAVTVTTRDGITLRSTPLGIGLYDAASGSSLIIAAITNCSGVLVSSNRVVYENAFAGVCADVVYTIDRGSFEQDVVITGRLDPADYGFPTNTTRVEIYTEFYNVAQQPDRIVRPIWVEPDKTVRDRMVSPDLVDEVLGFGEFVLATGRASTLSRMTVDPDAAGAPVAKQFMTVAERTFLTEAVQFSSIQEELLNLPECGPQTASIQKTGRAKMGKARYAAIPSPDRNSHGRIGTQSTDKSATRMAAVAVNRCSGVVIDYKATIGGTLNSPIPPFQGDTTYLVSGAVVCNGAVTIEAGAVFKFKYLSPATASIKLLNTLTCKTSSYRPAFFTAVDDDSLGESMNGYTNSGYTGVINPNKYANPALWLYSVGSQTLSNLRFTYCQEALRVELSTVNTLWHSQFVNCILGIRITGSGSGSGSSIPITVNNALFAGVQFPLTVNTLNSYPSFYHCTVDAGTSSTLVTASTTCSATFINSAFANVTTLYTGAATLSGNNNGFYNSPQFGSTSSRFIATASPFQPAQVAGNYYLVSDSNFRNAGTTSGIDSTLLSDLKLRTTDPPIPITTPISTATSWYAGVRDADVPDLGYHYDALDYLLNNVTLSATLSLANGVAVGLQNTYGLDLQPGAQVSSEGTPLKMNRVVSLANVQEQPIATGGTTFMKLNATSGASDLDFRFTDVSVAQGTLGTPLDTGGTSSNPFDRVSFRDCWLHEAALTFYPSTTSAVTAGFTNNLIERCKLTIGHTSTSLNTPFSVYFYNNLFLGDPNSATPGTPPALSLIYDSGTSNPAWQVHDNLFDKASQTLTGSSLTSVSRSNDGFTTGTTHGIVGTSDQTGVTVTYQVGPLGKYYLPTTATQLINKGSRNADVAGLYHYTVKTAANTKEGTDSPLTVDIGFHYVGVNTSNLPVDTDNDGLPDYYEDRNGNGIYDTGDVSNWTVAVTDSDGDGLPDGWEYTYFGNITSQTGSGDPDGDGLSNQWEYQLGLNPVIDQSKDLGSRRNYIYSLLNRLTSTTGKGKVTITPDKEGNITNVTP